MRIITYAFGILALMTTIVSCTPEELATATAAGLSTELIDGYNNAKGDKIDPPRPMPLP